MNGINIVLVTGTLGSKPELVNFPNGGCKTTLSVATSRKWIDSQTGENKEKTQWHMIVLNNRSAEVACQYLDKGDKVSVQGYLETRSYTKDNVKHFVTEIISQNMQMVSVRNKATPDVISDDLRF